MYISIITPEFPPYVGGIGRSAERIALSLSNDGHRIKVFTYDRSQSVDLPPYARDVAINGFFLTRIGPIAPNRSLDNPSKKARLKRQFIETAIDIIRQEPLPDIILSLGITDAGSVGTCISNALGIPHVVSGRGADVSVDLFQSDKFAIANWVVSNARAVTFVNTHLYEIARMFFGNSIPSSTIANGIDYPTGPTTGDRKNARVFIRERLQIPADATVIGWSGTFREKKGLLDLGAMFAQLVRRVPNAHMLIVGGPRNLDDRHLLPILDDPTCGPRIRITGLLSETEEVIRHYCAMDLFVYPSIDDGMSNALLEAMALELPVITTEIFADLFNEEGIAVLVNRYDSDSLTLAALQLLDNPEQARSMASKARRHVLEHFSATREARDYLELFGRILEAEKTQSRGSAPSTGGCQ